MINRTFNREGDVEIMKFTFMQTYFNVMKT